MLSPQFSIAACSGIRPWWSGTSRKQKASKAECSSIYLLTNFGLSLPLKGHSCGSRGFREDR